MTQLHTTLLQPLSVYISPLNLIRIKTKIKLVL
jgi:hypothetical protein